jgi:ribosome-binding protein aMBF1 (putative translation factor)
MYHQDFKILVLRKSEKNMDKRNIEKTSVSKKRGIPQFKKSLDDNLETFTTEKVSYTLKMKIQKARVAAKLSQKDIAQKINVTQKTIQSYENGTAIPDHQVLQKLRRILKVKL